MQIHVRAGHKEIFISSLRARAAPAIGSAERRPAGAPQIPNLVRTVMTAQSKAAKKAAPVTAATDYVVKDVSLAEGGRKENAIAETEMAGRMAGRGGEGPEQPRRGARSCGS